MSQTGPDGTEETEGLSEGIESSDEDPRFLLLLSVVLSLVSGWAVIAGLNLVDIASFTPINVGGVTIATFALIYTVILN
ncbi:MAG: hypothetical protein A07HR60_00464 [uncultured archaeon A07HR60]|nr:MAG: hypothetical protein A07HR60_00464 [uncultured archaeon A07HR60]